MINPLSRAISQKGGVNRPQHETGATDQKQKSKSLHTQNVNKSAIGIQHQDRNKGPRHRGTIVEHHSRQNRGKPTKYDPLHAEYHHDQHRKSFFHLIPHHDFFASDESTDEIQHAQQRKKRLSKAEKGSRRNRLASNKLKLGKAEEDECKKTNRRKSQIAGKDKRQSNVTDDAGYQAKGLKRINIIENEKKQVRPILQPYTAPPKVIIRPDGVKIFPRHPVLVKPKPQRPFTAAEIELRRRSSNVVLQMPIAIDEAERSVRITNRLIQKMIRYIKRSWYVRINRKNSLLEIRHRLNQRMYHGDVPGGSWVKRHAREKMAETSGFFSNIREHYVDLGDLETSTAMLIFKNLPPDLHITTTKWLKDIADIKARILKRDTPVPRVLRTRTRKPAIPKSRVKLDAGGQKTIEDFVKTAEMFQRSIRGTQTYVHLLERWRQDKDDEAAKRASPFGILKRQAVIAESKIDNSQAEKRNDMPNIELREQKKPKRDSFAVDDRTFQREMHYFEQMMTAMYDIIKTLLNITSDLLASKLPLSHSTLLELRDRSPDAVVEQEKKKVPRAILKKTIHKELYTAATSIVQSVMDLDYVRTALESKDYLGSEMEEEEEDVEEEKEEEEEAEETETTSIKKTQPVIQRRKSRQDDHGPIPSMNQQKKATVDRIDKFEWDTMRRYRIKLKAITPNPIYQKTIAKIRRAMLHSDEKIESTVADFKRAARWYRKLIDKAEGMGAFLHHGCHTKINKLHKYCDVDMNSKTDMIARCCLIVVSLPVTELGEPYWQDAITFVLKELLAAPVDLFRGWLQYRNLPYLL